MTLRFKLPPGGDVPPAVAARRLGLALEEFEAALPDLLANGFPAPDQVTGNYDLDAIEVWRRLRYPHLFPAIPLPAANGARDAKDVDFGERLRRLRRGNG
jgi:hypothetical protein